MTNTKLYSVLAELSVYELNRFHKFVHSPYFNKNALLTHLLLLIEANLKGKSNLKSKEDFWSEIHQGSKYDDLKFRKICSDLLKLFERFLAQQIFDHNPLHQANYLIESLSLKKLQKLYNTSIKSARRLSEQQHSRPASFYFYQYELEKNYYQLTDFDLKRAVKSNLEEITENLDKFYLAEKLKYYCAVLSRKKIIDHDYQILFIEEIIEHIKQFDYQAVPPIAIYYQIYLSIVDEENETHFRTLKSLIDKHISQFPAQEAFEIYDATINYWIKKLNKGNPDALNEIFILYKDALGKNILHIDGKITPWMFTNIVVVGLRLNQFKWVESFIGDYQHTILEDYRENAASYNRAQLYFYQKDYKQVIQVLQTVEYEDVSYNLNAKAMLLATYYETDEFDALNSLFGSFRTYLNRNKKIPESRRENYNNLIKFTKKLSGINTSDKSSVKKLKEEISQSKSVVSKRWLLEKISELE